MSERIYQLSKELGISNQKLIVLLQERGFEVRSASSSVADIYAEDLRSEFGKNIAEPAASDSAVASGTESEDKKSPERKSEGTNDGNGIDDSVSPTNGVKNAKRGRVFPALAAKSRPIFQDQHSTKSPEKNSVTSTSATPQNIAPLPQRSLIREAQSAPETPQLRMIPLNRLQSAVSAQHRRFGQTGNHSSYSQKPGFPPSVGGKFGQSRRDFTGKPTTSSDSKPAGARAGNIRSGSHSGANPSFEKNVANNKKPFPNAAGRDFNFRKKPETLPGGFNLPPSKMQIKKIDEEAVPEVFSEKKILKIKLPVALREFAPMINLKAFQLISILMRRGIFASMNYLVEEVLARELAAEQGFQIEAKISLPTAAKPIQTQKELPQQFPLEPRAPIVCVLGHVDHGKTTLLDAFRKTNVVAGEAGGITQHIGAYEVKTGDRTITFIDTPGHAAFSKMRERGANVTDVAILIVAADDGFMPQTDEALKFAQKAGVPVVVAINKIDAKGANVDRVKQQMQQRNIAPEEWGGETLYCGISALQGTHLEELLESILLQAEMLDLKAPQEGPVLGMIMESQVEQGRGPTASAIIQEGVVKVGDALICGNQFCKVRALMDDKGNAIKSAGPSKPVKIIGWSGPLESGSPFYSVANEKEARRLAEEFGQPLAENLATEENSRKNSHYRERDQEKNEKLDALFAAINAKQKKTLQVILRSDVQGSSEALQACLEALPQDKVNLQIIANGVGSVLKSDVEMANDVGAILVAFNVKPETGVLALLKRYGIQLIQHNIIYELIDQVRDAMADLLDPELREEKLGAAQIRQVFTLTKGIIAGCMVTEGKILRDAFARLRRQGKILAEGRMGSLRRIKDDVNEVRAGYECGIAIAGHTDYAEGDIVESYQIQKIRPSL